MFTRDFRKLRLVLATTGSLALLFVAINVALLRLSTWAEVQYKIYPLNEEDYLRYLLPHLFENRGRDRIMLVGPSEVREGMLFETFDREFPAMHAFNGAQSLGTFDDLLVTMDYVEKVYGSDAMPSVLVVGVTPRFVANIRSAGVESPVINSINRYSPYYRVEQTSGDSLLVPKTTWAGLVGRTQFLLRQRARYRLGLYGALHAFYGRFLSDNAFARKLRLGPALERRVSAFAVPYKYHHDRPLAKWEMDEWLNHPDSFWYRSAAWDPAKDAPAIRRQFTRLEELTARLKIDLYVVNLPEHLMVRQSYQPQRYQQYLELVEDSLGSTPFLNLREMLGPNEFYDLGHPMRPGASRETDQIVKFIKEQGRVVKIIKEQGRESRQ